MSYLALWLKGDEIVAEDEFEDLLEAEAYVLDHLKDNRARLGATHVKVCDERTVYFQIE